MDEHEAPAHIVESISTAHRALVEKARCVAVQMCTEAYGNATFTETCDRLLNTN